MVYTEYAGHAEIEEGTTICPNCGKELEQINEAVIFEQDCNDTQIPVDDVSVGTEDPIVVPLVEQKAKRSVMPLVLSIIAAVAAVGALAVV